MLAWIAFIFGYLVNLTGFGDAPLGYLLAIGLCNGVSMAGFGYFVVLLAEKLPKLFVLGRVAGGKAPCRRQ